MGVSWAAQLPVVETPEGEPKRITLIVPHYDNRRWLVHQAATWMGYPFEVLRRLSVIVVDDCSEGGPPEEELRSVLRYGGFQTAAAAGFSLRLFALEQDVRWNWLAARNIGAKHAADGWLLLTDIDHVVTNPVMGKLQAGAHDPGTIYGFSRVEGDGTVIAPHPNSWLITRSMFWKVGGYDEALSGYYGTDGDWRRRMAATAPIKILRDQLVRFEHVLDSSTTRYKRKQPEDAAVKGIIARRRPGWRPTVHRFPYREVIL